VRQLIPGAVYEFKLRSVNGYVLGGWSGVASATVTGVVPGSATNLRAIAGNNEVRLTWTPAPNATGYLLTYSAPGYPVRTMELPLIGSSWSGWFTNDVTWTFQLRSINGYVKGGYSAQVQARPTAGNSPPPGTPGWRCVIRSSGWFTITLRSPERGQDIDVVYQQSDVTNSMCGVRNGSSMSLTMHWDTAGHELRNGTFKFHLYDCTVGGNPVFERILDYETPPGITSATVTSSVPINPQHWYKIRTTGGGKYDGQPLVGTFDHIAPEGILSQNVESTCF
jgi:hypothetical protein